MGCYLLTKYLKRFVKSSKDNFLKVSSKNTIELKTSSELKIMKIAGQMAGKVLKLVSKNIKAGISTKQLDAIAENEIRSLGALPAFLGYRGYPATACISINEELVHGIPSEKRIIKDGDIVSIDLGVVYEGYYGDTAATYAVGNPSSEIQRLLDTTKASLVKAIEQSKAGNRLGDISWAVQSFAESAGYAVVRDYCGHGIGRKLHEDPSIPNFGHPKSGVRLVPGMVLAIEPMLNAGDYRVKTLEDEWTVVTADGKLCAHFEHMVAITEDGPDVLTKV